MTTPRAIFRARLTTRRLRAILNALNWVLADKINDTITKEEYEAARAWCEDLLEHRKQRRRRKGDRCE